MIPSSETFLMPPVEIAGQLNSEERRIITAAILDAPKKPEVVLEVGTWLGGGSTLHFLRALEKNGTGRLWGIEADRSIYNQMIENIPAAAPEAIQRFMALFGFSSQVIPGWLKELGPEEQVDLVFLDGGDNPFEQIQEFMLLADRIRIGGQLFAHDAKLRKGKWLLPYLSLLDNWKVELHDISTEGLLSANKLAAKPSPQSSRAARLKLRSMRLQPIELIGRLLPSPVCDALLMMMPARFRSRVSQGR